MPLDCSLFADLNYALQFHHAFTTSVTDKNPLKFSMSSPFQISRCIDRLWPEMFLYQTEGDVVFLNSRIVTDIRKVFKSLKLIILHKGTMVPGCGNRSGVRFPGFSINKRGGVRVKGSGK